MLFVPTGLAAVVNLALIPIAMLVFGILLKEEVASVPKLVAIGLGVSGLLLLFGPGAAEDAHARDSLTVPLAAIVVGTLCGCAGTVIGRPVLRVYSAPVVAGWTNLAGGLLILFGSLLLERGAPARAVSAVDLATVIAWTFLVVFGSGIAMTVYLKLVREWGAVRASGYAFLSPLIALAIGVLVQGERLTTAELAASGLLLTAVVFNLVPRLVTGADVPQESPR
jgi:drug/metabolite transporter (DMT)-like permease